MKLIIQRDDEGLLLRQYLRDKLQFSSRFIKRLTTKSGYLTINGENVTVRYKLKQGDVLRIFWPEEIRSDSMRAEKMPLQIVYEDDWIIVINKPAGIPSIPSRLHPRGTIANGLLAYYDERNLPYTIHIVTRLDKDTSGLMLVAKHQISHSILQKNQQNNDLVRIYEAIVAGILQEKRATIDRPIRRKQTSIIEREVHPSGKSAVTHYEVIKQYAQYAHVSIKLETGRTHQIRVHFASIGHTLL